MVMEKIARLMTIGILSHQTDFGLELINLNEQNKDFIRSGAAGFSFNCDENGNEHFYCDYDDTQLYLSGNSLTFQFFENLSIKDEEIQFLYAKNQNIARFILNHNRLHTGMRFVRKVLNHYCYASVDQLLCLPVHEQDYIIKYIYKHMVGQLPPKFVNNDMLSFEKGRLMFYGGEDIADTIKYLQHGDFDFDKKGLYGCGLYFYDRTYKLLDASRCQSQEDVLIAKLSSSAKVIDFETLMAMKGLLLPDKIDFFSRNINCGYDYACDAKKLCQSTKMWTILAFLSGFDALSAPVDQDCAERYIIPLVKNKLILPIYPRLKYFIGCRYDLLSNVQTKI